MAVKKKTKAKTSKKASKKKASKKTAAKKAPSKKAAGPKAKKRAAKPAGDAETAAPETSAAAPAAAGAEKPKAASGKTIRVKLVKSIHGRVATHKACARGLGLRRPHQTVEVEDTLCTRGMINKIRYMLEIEGQ